MSETKCPYAKTENKPLATTRAHKNFTNFIVEKHFLIETDHKHLFLLLGDNHLDTLPTTFICTLTRFSYNIPSINCILQTHFQ